MKLFQKIVRIGDAKYLTSLKPFSMLETLNQGGRVLGWVLERRGAIKIFLGISGKKFMRLITDLLNHILLSLFC